MGVIDSVPTAFALTVVDGRQRLTFTGMSATAPLCWGEIRTLALDAPVTGGSPPPEPSEDASAVAARFQRRRLLLRAATLVAPVDQLRASFVACPLADEGISAPRLWMDAAGPTLAGRFAHGDREAAFTVRVSIDARSDGRRRLRVGFADVRLFAALSIPGPLVGVAVARAISNAATRAGADARLVGAALDIDPLELALIFSLVTGGWRLPDLRQGWLRSLVHSPDDVQLLFGVEDQAPDGASVEGLALLEPLPPPAPLAKLERERLPDACAAAEELLFAGDLAGAEGAYRVLVTDDNSNRAARARLLSLRAAADGDDVTALAGEMMNEWPDYLPGVLHAATAAALAGDTTRASALFDRAADLAESRGESEDAALARDAAMRLGGPAPSEPVAPPEEFIPDVSGVVQPAAGTSITEKTAAVYAEADASGPRAEALGQLLQGFEHLPPERRHDAYASFGRVAEATGDLDHAEEAFWRATSTADDPVRRAGDLAAHARVLVSRGNTAGAVKDLEEALRLLPLDAVKSLAEIRQSLGELYHRLCDWSAARHYLELVLAQEPTRVVTLERLADIYPHLGLYSAAAEALERLARRYSKPRERAEALWRQGDILRERLGDDARAFNAYLKSSDVDPTFAPTALRLMAGFWAEGQFQDVAAVADDLLQAGRLPAVGVLDEMDDPLRLRVGIAVALAHGDAARAADMVALAQARWSAYTAAAILAETAAHLANHPSHEIEPAVSLLELWRGNATQSGAGSAVTELWSALRAQVMEDPAAPGLARATGWIAERAGDSTAAGIFLSVATFIEEADHADLAPTDSDAARATMAAWDEFRAHADRGVAPVCRDILAGLRALHQIEAAAPVADAQASERSRRVAFLRTAPARDLLRFMASDSYARALREVDAGV